MMLICKKNPFSKTKIHKFDVSVAVKEVMIDVPQDPLNLKIILKEQMFSVVFDTDKERNSWKDSFQGVGVPLR